MKVICIKMNSGEDLIARLSTQAIELGAEPWSMPQEEVVLEDIRVVSLQPISRTEMSVALIPYLLGDVDAPFKITLPLVAVGIYKPGDELEKSYLAQTSPLDLTTVTSKIQLN